MSVQRLNDEVIRCVRCPRLVEYRQMVAREKVKRFKDEPYWGRPVPGFGDADPRILIVGLAPAAHGANRTGRMFTGDSSGDWLYRALYEAGFANRPASVSANDDLALNQVYITASVRCAPPQNKPAPQEMTNCRSYLEEEVRLFKNVQAYVPLGQIAFNNICRVLGIKGLKFGHGQFYQLADGKKMLCSYHPSRQNTQTGVLKWEDWLRIFQTARRLIS